MQNQLRIQIRNKIWNETSNHLPMYQDYGQIKAQISYEVDDQVGTQIKDRIWNQVTSLYQLWMQNRTVKELPNQYDLCRACAESLETLMWLSSSWKDRGMLD